MKNKDCGSCKNFLKVKGNFGNSGLCVIKDCRTDTDRGHSCDKFKRIKFFKGKEMVKSECNE